MSETKIFNTREFSQVLSEGLKNYGYVTAHGCSPLVMAIWDAVRPYLNTSVYSSGYIMVLLPMLCSAVTGLVTGVAKVPEVLNKVYMEYWTSTVTIDDSQWDVLHKVIAWANHNIPATGRNIKVTDKRVTGLNERSIDFQPAGRYAFVHENLRFWLEHTVPKGNTNDAIDYLTITCGGRDTRPLKDFVKMCEAFTDELVSEAVQVFKPNDHFRQFQRPIFTRRRDMLSIDMEEDVKADLVRDAQKYFHPASKAYYANRGIPLRRGYLFWGPPGCGKTSICVALASMLQLQLFSISLASANANDRNLEKLFSTLPKKCIVLLEDIDSAGISRENMAQAASGKFADREKGFDDKHLPPRVTLSGLLNVIDGAGAAEGRLIIMTSNHPETLDHALIRPGRIDKQVYFGHVSKSIAAAMFKRIYNSYGDGEEQEQDADLDDVMTDVDAVEDLDLLADAFALQVPESALTPAELQCFLLERRNSPSDAVRDFEQWAIKTMTAKLAREAGGAKKMQPQRRANQAKANSTATQGYCSDDDVYFSARSHWSP
ncbi:P-loop containing nucleoside triphosphate hydrolase protein [Phyllosticta citriasiana]|uniref:P-loop containing nucleoside triphosphate hydrolase protein n=1 Tax=Phyllosticta citriasiana TaxID=595635 RepID=A0ABR1L4M8_9PEZI